MSNKPTPIELYDMGRCTHNAIPGMYKFIVNHAHKFTEDQDLASELKAHAKNREQPGYSIPQEHFSEMCRVWVTAYRSKDFVISPIDITYPDTPVRFKKVKSAQRRLGVITSGSQELAGVVFSLEVNPISSLSLAEGIWQFGLNYFSSLSDYVDEFFFGESIGDKDNPDTFSNLWEAQKGSIYAIFDDKLSVCQAALAGLAQVGGKANIYLVDRNGKYDPEKQTKQSQEITERLKALEALGVTRIKSFDEVND